MIKSNLKKILAQKEMTQAQLAKSTGIRQPTISAIATNAQKQYPVKVLDKLCSCLGCQPGDILEYREENHT